jgi:hypothetical protein
MVGLLRWMGLKVNLIGNLYVREVIPRKYFRFVLRWATLLGG